MAEEEREEATTAMEAAEAFTVYEMLAAEALVTLSQSGATVSTPEARNAPPPLPAETSTPASNKKRRKRKQRAMAYIPVDVVELILMRMNPKNAVRLGTSCKDWTAAAARVNPTKRKAPWLLVQTNSNTTCALQSVTDPKVSFKIRIHGFVLRHYHFGGSWNGWLVLQPNRRGQISLLNPFSRARWDLPILPRGGLPSRSLFYMSSAPTTSGCVLFVRKLTTLYVWSPGHEFWTAEHVEATEFNSILSVQGQFYAMNKEGRLISFRVFPLRIMELHVRRPPVYNVSRQERFLVESCGEILYVVIAERESTEMSVFRLDLGNRAWVKTTRLGDRALFLHWKQGISVSAGEAGCKGNCVYYSRRYDSRNVWRVYDLEKQSFTHFPRRDCPHRSFHDNVWITPEN
ncbi:unnamed protein product [Musa hybrid cultivar]